MTISISARAPSLPLILSTFDRASPSGTISLPATAVNSSPAGTTDHPHMISLRPHSVGNLSPDTRFLRAGAEGRLIARPPQGSQQMLGALPFWFEERIGTPILQDSYRRVFRKRGKVVERAMIHSTFAIDK